jgi:hypothetical protein
VSGAKPAPVTRYAIDVRRYRDALRDAVELSITTRGVLYVLAQWMNTDGTNARPRLSRLAASCQLRQRAVAKHLSDAIASGYLHRTSGGHKGRTAVYQAAIPIYRWNEDTMQLVQPLAVEEPSQSLHGDAGKEPKACTEEPQSLHAETSKPAPACSPTSKETSLLLRRSRPRGACAPGAASAAPRGYDPNQHDPMDWIEGQVHGFEANEESTALAMLGEGYHPHAIVNTINKQRAA